MQEAPLRRPANAREVHYTMPQKKYYRVGERPPPRGPATDRLWQPPPRDDAATPAPAPAPKPPGRRRSLRRRSLRTNPPSPANPPAAEAP